MIPVGLFILIAVAWAWRQAMMHAPRIKAMTMTKAFKRVWTISRGLLIIATAVGCGLLHFPWLGAAAGAFGCECLFTVLFRQQLAQRIGWDPNYLGSTSTYDVLIIHIETGISTADIRKHHDVWYKFNDNGYQDKVHNACRRFTELEVICAVLTFALCIASPFLHLP